MMKINKLLIYATMLLGLNSITMAATEGVDYRVLPNQMKQLESDKVEVLEFFAYWCPHCYHLSPVILKHSKTFADDTYLRMEHVVWDPQRDLNFARIAAAVGQAGLKYQATPVIFDAVVLDGLNLSNPDFFTKWVQEQKQFDGKKLLGAYNSFANQAQAKQMADWTIQYQIESTPTVIVGGKYELLFPNGFEAGMKTIDELVQKIRQERGMKVPKKVVPHSIANSLVQSANQ